MRDHPFVHLQLQIMCVRIAWSCTCRARYAADGCPDQNKEQWSKGASNLSI